MKKSTSIKKPSTDIVSVLNETKERFVNREVLSPAELSGILTRVLNKATEEKAWKPADKLSAVDKREKVNGDDYEGIELDDWDSFDDDSELTGISPSRSFSDGSVKEGIEPIEIGDCTVSICRTHIPNLYRNNRPPQIDAVVSFWFDDGFEAEITIEAAKDRETYNKGPYLGMGSIRLKDGSAYMYDRERGKVDMVEGPHLADIEDYKRVFYGLVDKGDYQTLIDKNMTPPAQVIDNYFKNEIARLGEVVADLDIEFIRGKIKGLGRAAIGPNT